MQSLSTKTELTKNSFKIGAGEHLIGEFGVDKTGATLIVFGSVHGNEASGAIALQKIANMLPELSGKLRGRVYFLAGNTRAFIKGTRFIDSDLNRHWTAENIKRNQANGTFQAEQSEDFEQHELLKTLKEVLRTARGEVYALDLHSTSATGESFATVGDTLRNREFAQKFPVTILLGIEEQLDGTILEYLNNAGAITLGYEGGQHFAESTIDAHEALTWLALVNSGILRREDLPDFEKHFEVLQTATGKPRVVEIRYRHAITANDDFKMQPNYNNFQPVKRGELLANQKSGAVRANETGLILMPLYQSQGEDGFFLGREIAPFWLKLSGLLRKMKIGNLMRFLPGVSVSKTDSDVFEINTKIAHFFPLQIFHLLGFRRRRQSGNKLIVSRRKFDTKSPFTNS